MGGSSPFRLDPEELEAGVRQTFDLDVVTTELQPALAGEAHDLFAVAHLAPHRPSFAVRLVAERRRHTARGRVVVPEGAVGLEGPEALEGGRIAARMSLPIPCP